MMESLPPQMMCNKVALYKKALRIRREMQFIEALRKFHGKKN